MRSKEEKPRGECRDRDLFFGKYPGKNLPMSFEGEI
jgi:hypothetical protein